MTTKQLTEGGIYKSNDSLLVYKHGNLYTTDINKNVSFGYDIVTDEITLESGEELKPLPIEHLEGWETDGRYATIRLGKDMLQYRFDKKILTVFLDYDDEDVYSDFLMVDVLYFHQIQMAMNLMGIPYDSINFIF